MQRNDRDLPATIDGNPDRQIRLVFLRVEIGFDPGRPGTQGWGVSAQPD